MKPTPTTKWQNIFRIILGGIMILAAIGHFTFQREEFQAQVPDWVPLSKDLVVILSGIAELALGLSMIFWTKHRAVIGCLLALFFVAIFPGNIAQYVNGVDAFGLESDQARIIRLFFQPLLILWALWSSGALGAWRQKDEVKDDVNTIYDFETKDIQGQDVSLSKYKGQAMLIANTATQCAFTKQFEGLERLYQDYKNQGFVVLGFPSNQFANQEPLDKEKLVTTCQINWGVSFPLFAKSDVNGDGANPIFTYLKQQKGGFITEDIKWNFTKFLIDQQGRTIKRYAPFTPPEQIRKDIEYLLNKNESIIHKGKTG